MTYVDHDHITTKYFEQKTCHYKTVEKLFHYCFNNEVHLRKFRISFQGNLPSSEMPWQAARGGALSEFLGGDVPLGPWNP